MIPFSKSRNHLQAQWPCASPPKADLAASQQRQQRSTTTQNLQESSLTHNQPEILIAVRLYHQFRHPPYLLTHFATAIPEARPTKARNTPSTTIQTSQTTHDMTEKELVNKRLGVLSFVEIYPAKMRIETDATGRAEEEHQRRGSNKHRPNIKEHPQPAKRAASIRQKIVGRRAMSVSQYP